uniref:Chromosome 16 open reading frame 86 n=1 Tax=Cercocebus atys TaxID=9531 RepID=A0A2K5MS22_CERAT
MASAGAERRPGVQEATVVGQGQLAEFFFSAQTSECPVAEEHFLVFFFEARGTQGEDQRPAFFFSELELQEEGPKLVFFWPKPEAGALEERGFFFVVSIVRPRHGPKSFFFKSLSLPGLRAHPKAEAELPPRLPLQEEVFFCSQSEPSPSAKQHFFFKKRKSLGAPVLHAFFFTVSAQRLRPLYQYINYCFFLLNQAGEGDGEAEAELALVPEEAGVFFFQALLPLAGELGPGLALPCPRPLVTPIHALFFFGEEAGEEAGGLPFFFVSDHHKAEVDKSTFFFIDKMLSVCTAPLVFFFSPQYK